MKINKKAQLLEKPFIHIFAAIVSALVLLFGFYLVTNLLKTSNCTQAGLAFNDLQTAVNRYYNFDIGSSTEYNLKLPKKIKYVCLANGDEASPFVLDKIENGLSTAFSSGKYNLAFSPISYCSKSFFKLEKVNVKEGTFCLLNTGGVKFYLENKGEFVEIS